MGSPATFWHEKNHVDEEDSLDKPWSCKFLGSWGGLCWHIFAKLGSTMSDTLGPDSGSNQGVTVVRSPFNDATCKGNHSQITLLLGNWWLRT